MWAREGVAPSVPAPRFAPSAPHAGLSTSTAVPRSAKCLRMPTRAVERSLMAPLMLDIFHAMTKLIVLMVV